VKRAVEAGKALNGTGTTSLSGMRRELMRMPGTHQTDRFNHYPAQDNDDLITSESDRQLLLIKYVYCFFFCPSTQRYMQHI
jgi:SYP6 family syntaxin